MLPEGHSVLQNRPVFHHFATKHAIDMSWLLQENSLRDNGEAYHSICELPGHGLLTRYVSCGLGMRRECWERFSRHRLQTKPLVSDPGMHHGTCVTHVPLCMSKSLTRGGGENVPVISGACATRNITYLVRGPCMQCVLGLFSISYLQSSNLVSHLASYSIPSNMWSFLSLFP